MINFYLPDFFYLFKLNISTILYMKQHPDLFYDDIKVRAVYGAFPPSIWNGGRTMSFDFVERNAIIAALKNFNGLGVACRFTFTNILLKEKDVHDSYCNECLKLGNNGMNEVLVTSPVLESYIRERYPKYKIISSTVKGIKTIDGLNKELEKYPIVVADYTLNNKEDSSRSRTGKGAKSSSTQTAPTTVSSGRSTTPSLQDFRCSRRSSPFIALTRGTTFSPSTFTT